MIMLRQAVRTAAIALDLLGMLVSTGRATEYFVAKTGSDAADGLTATTAFATIATGVAALKPGDTLTILPGQYLETVTAKVSGTPEAPVTIRAQRPGTVLLRGDVDVRGFQRAEGTEYTYWIPFDKRVEGVAERANLRLYEPMLSVPEVEQNLATFYQDQETNRLYVHTADSSPPDWNALSASVTNGFGLLLPQKAHDVVIDGLAFTGYNTRDYPDGPGSRSRWGLMTDFGVERVVIRRCVAFLNSGGIFLSGPADAVVEDCYAFANVGRFLGLGGNILAWSGHNTVFRRNVVEGFWDVPTSAADIAFYGGVRSDKKPPSGGMENNLAINAGLMIKGAFGDDNTFQRGNCVIGRGAYFYREPGTENLLLHHNESDAARRSYADPIAHDYRLQSDAPARGQGPNGTDLGPFPYRDEVFFVSPSGDDEKTGTSLTLAWKTLAHAARTAQAGQTVYVTEGVYHESLTPANSGAADRPLTFRRRGRDKVVLDGRGERAAGIDLAGRSHVHVGGFVIRNFAGHGIQAKDGRDVHIEHVIVTDCGGAAVAVSDVKGLALSRSLLRDNKGGGVRLERSPGAWLSGIIFDRNGGPGIRLDGESRQDLCSEANAFGLGVSPITATPAQTFAALPAWQRATGLDTLSIVADPGYRDGEGGDFSLRPDSALIGRGPQGRPVGPYLRVPMQGSSQVENLAARAVTATTATLECWTPKSKSPLTIEWGDTPECKNKVESPSAILHSVGITGLQPGTTYFFRAGSARSSDEYRWAPCRVPELTGRTAAAPVAPLSFATLPQRIPGRTYHVAVTGADARSGLSQTDAWRTIAGAAGRVRAGDTVLIHGGKYEEFVLVRATGAKDAPITFRAAPGETVWMEGSERFRPTAFRLHQKHHIHIDGIRFRHFRRGGCIVIVGGSNNVIRRCFHDGREREGYVGPLCQASNTANLVIENCVMINGMDEGLVFSRCPDATVRHCVFYSNFIRALTAWQFDPKLIITFSHNLICDVIPAKGGSAFIRLSHLECLRSDHNAYFTRVGQAERRIVEAASFQGKKLGFQGRGQYYGESFLLEDVQKQTGQEVGSVFGNPGIRAVKELVPRGASSGAWMKTEMHWDGKAFGPLDFADFCGDPDGPMAKAADGRPLGLDPAAFR